MREQEYFPNTDPQVDISQEIDQQAIEQEMIKKLSRGFNIDEAINEVKDIIKKFNVSDEIVQDAAKEGMIKYLSGTLFIDDAKKIKQEFNVSEEVTQEAVKEGMMYHLSMGYDGRYIYNAIRIKQEFNVSEEVTQEVVEQGMINSLDRGHINTAVRIKQEFNVPDEIINSPGVQKAAKQEIIHIFYSKGFAHNAVIIKQEFNVPKETINLSEVQEAAEQGMIDSFYRGYIDNAKTIKEEFNVSEEVTQKIVKQGMIDRLSNRDIDTAIKIKQEFNVSKEIISLPEVQDVAIQEMRECLSYKNVNDAKKIKEEFYVSEEATQEAVKQRMIDSLDEGDIDTAIKIKQEFNVSKETINLPEVQDAAKQGMMYCLSRGYINEEYIYNAIRIKQEFNVSEEVTQKAAKQGMIDRLSNRDIDTAIKIKQEFNVSKEIISLPEVQDVAIQEMRECLSYKNVNDAKKIKEEFYVSEEATQEAVKQRMIDSLDEGDIDTAIKIKQEFNVSKETINLPEVQDAAKQGMMYCLSRGYINEEYIYNAIRIKQEFNVSEEVTQKAAKQGMIDSLDGGYYIDTAIKIKQKFNVSDEIINSSEVQQVAKEGMIHRLSWKDIDDAKKIKQEFNVSEKVTQQVVKQGMIHHLFNRDIDIVKEIIKEFNVSDEIVQQVAKEGMVHHLSYEYKNVDDAIRIKQEFNVSDEIVQQAAKEGMVHCLSREDIDDAKKIKQEFNVSEEVTQDAAEQGMISCLMNGRIYTAIEIKQEFNVSEEATQEAVKQGMINCLSDGNIYTFIEIKQEFNVSEEATQEAVKQGMIECLFYDRIDTAKEIKQEFNTILSKQDLDYCVENKKFKSIDNGKNFFDEDCQHIYEEAEEFNLLVSEFLFIENDVDQLKQMDIESRSKYIFDKLKGNHENWTDEQNIITPFESGSEIFGHSKMFKYIFREDITKHDALYDFLRIIDLYNASGLSSNEFFNNILQQVKDDTSNYESGTSYHLLNNIARNVNINFEETIDKAKQYDLPTLTKLLESINSSQDIFSSWKMLKKYNELCSILNKSEVLEQLKGLKETGGSIDLHNYIETLAFHPNIAMAKVIQFWKNPEEFLDIGDSHTPDDVHNRKKPSNYVDIPNLDLSAKELRDALVEGYYDHLQVFEPLEINYKILTEGKYKDKELNELISIAVGKRSERIKGEAKNPDKLFSEFQKLFKKNGINLTEYLRDTAVDKKQQEDVVNSIKKQIMDLVYDKNIGLKDDRKFEEYRAVINLKSDPNGVVAGNDTACCMPFGSGKNNIYTFNPICSLFTVRRLVSVDENGKKQWKTVAQSVLTENIDIEKNISGVIDKLNQSDVHMHDIVDDQALLDKPGVITCDNIEVEHNFESKAGSFNILKHIYLDYFKEYIKRFAKTHNLDENRVIVGLGSTDANISYDRIENTYAPKAPVGYSDNLHNKAMLLDLSKYQGSNMFASRDVRIQEKKAKIKEQEQIDLPKGVTELTFKDSIPVAYIEGKAYKDNQKLIEYLHNMENALIAKDVYNTYKGKPNMSFKYTGSDRKMHGYILAYEGKMDKEDKDSKDIVYVSDLASDGNLRAGGSLILAFAEAYKKHHIDKNNIIPILAQFREKTSYQIIAKQLEKLTKDTGIEFETEELDSYKVGDDTMHEVIIRKKK
ncbi:MAG TPA: hypothetical protein PKL50_00505 [bacterium]|nr:hypothetical protein [bacterium]